MYAQCVYVCLCVVILLFSNKYKCFLSVNKDKMHTRTHWTHQTYFVIYPSVCVPLVGEMCVCVCVCICVCSVVRVVIMCARHEKISGKGERKRDGRGERGEGR